MGRFNTVLRSIAGIPVAYYGFTFQKAWPSRDGFMPLPAELDAGISTATGVSSAALSLLLMLYVAKGPRQQSSSKFLAAFGVLASLASALVAGGAWLLSIDAGPYFTLQRILKACGIVAMSALWLQSCASLNPIRAIFVNAVATVVAAYLMFVVEDASPLRSLSLMAILPFLSAFSLWRAEAGSARMREQTELSFSYPFKPALPVKALVFIGVYSFAYGVASSTVEASFTRYSSVIPAIVVILLVCLDFKRFSISTLYSLAFPLMIGGFLFIGLSSEHASPLPGFLLDTGYAAMSMLLFLSACSISYNTGASPLWLFGALSATQFGMHFAGQTLATFLPVEEGTAGYAALVAVTALIVIVASLATMSDKGMFTSLNMLSHDEKSAVESSFLTEKMARVNSLAGAYTLTSRETEVLQLLILGKSNAEMAGDLFISEGTVKTHLHHIYQKFGVHTRRELEEKILKAK